MVSLPIQIPKAEADCAKDYADASSGQSRCSLRIGADPRPHDVRRSSASRHSVAPAARYPFPLDRPFAIHARFVIFLFGVNDNHVAFEWQPSFSFLIRSQDEEKVRGFPSWPGVQRALHQEAGYMTATGYQPAEQRPCARGWVHT